jgi:hypothetical protein
MSEAQIPEPVFLDRLGGDEIYGFGQDGDVTLTANTSLSRDMYYDDLTINSGVTLDTNGYRVFVRGTLTFADSTSKIGRFTGKTSAGTLKGGFAKGTSATDTLGGASSEQGGSHGAGATFFSGENEMFNLSVAIAGKAFDVDSGSYKFIGGGSGASDGNITANATDGAAGSDTNWSDRNTVGAAGGKGASGNAATAGTGAVGGGVVIVVAKTVSGDGTVRADGDDATTATQGTDGAPAPDASTPGNSYSYPGNNYSYSGSNPHTHYHWHGYTINNLPTGGYHYHYAHWHPFTNYGSNNTNYGSNPTNYGSNSGSNPTNYGTNYGNNTGANNASNSGTNPNSSGTNPTNNDTNPTLYHPGGAGGSGGTATDGYNAGGGTVVFVTGTKPLPSGLTLAAAAGTGGSGSASAGTVVTVYNINADDTDPGA